MSENVVVPKYAPRSGGRVRYQGNVPGFPATNLKRAAVKAHRRTLVLKQLERIRAANGRGQENETLRSPVLIRRAIRKVKLPAGEDSGYVRCPYCGERNYVRGTGDITCWYYPCGETFFVEK